MNLLFPDSVLWQEVCGAKTLFRLLVTILVIKMNSNLVRPLLIINLGDLLFVILILDRFIVESPALVVVFISIDPSLSHHTFVEGIAILTLRNSHSSALDTLFLFGYFWMI